MSKENFTLIYEQLSEPIFRYCYFKISDRERAKEIMQETFIKTWEYASKEQIIDNVKAFLYRVAHNLCVNEVTRRKQNTSLETLQEETGFDPQSEELHSNVELSSEIRLLKEKIDMLDKKDAEIVTMKYINDMSVIDIAKALNMRENSVSVKLHRAIEKLKKLYE